MRRLTLLLVAAMLVGLVPALQASRPALTDSLKAGGASIGGGAFTFRRPGAHQVLVVSEVALALILLVGAGLLAKSFSRLHRLDVGFAPDHLRPAKRRDLHRFGSQCAVADDIIGVRPADIQQG